MKDTVFDFISRMTGGNKEVAELCAATIGGIGEGDVCLPLDKEQRELLESVRDVVATFVEDDTQPASVRTPFVVGPVPGGSSSLIYTRRNWVYERRVRDWILLSIREKMDDSALELPNDPFYASLRDEQKAAVIAMCNSRFSILTGGPGTGKTFTISRAVKYIHDRRPNFRLGLAAPTGKAAARMMESMPKDMGFAIPQATTIHKLLELNYDFVTFKHNRDNPLAFDWLVIDEASMIDLPLMAKLIDAIPASCRLTLAGDEDQLASVELGCVFHDLCRFQGVAVARLRESTRFPPDGDIAKLAAAVNAGTEEKADEAMAILNGQSDVVSYVDLANLSKDDTFDPAKWPGFADKVRAGFATFAGGPNGKEGEPTDPVEFALAHLNDFRVLCALRHGPFGSEQIARWIKKELEKKLDKKCPVPLMITKNDRTLDVSNGDVGVVMPDDSKTLHLPKGKQVRLELLPDTELAFASTVHKAQGSEYGDVAIVLPPNPGKKKAKTGDKVETEGAEEADSFKLLTREILYTAITRTKGRVHIWASDASVRHCATTPIRRASGLVSPNE